MIRKLSLIRKCGNRIYPSNCLFLIQFIRILTVSRVVHLAMLSGYKITLHFWKNQKMTNDVDRLIGQELEAYCTKCKQDTWHTVTSTKDDKVHKVLCKDCNTYHVFRPPKGSEAKKTTKRKTKATAKTTQKRVTRRRKVNWDTAITEIEESDIIDYAFSDDYREAKAIRHKAFGIGVITKVHDNKKIEVLFKEGAKLMGMNLDFSQD